MKTDDDAPIEYDIDEANAWVIGYNQAEKELLEKAIQILKNVKETLEYVKLYVENSGLSAEDDCIESLKEINDFLKEV